MQFTKHTRREAFEKGLRIFRVRNIHTGGWWEGIAKDKNDALGKASRETSTAIDDLSIREYSANGGWRKP